MKMISEREYATAKQVVETYERLQKEGAKTKEEILKEVGTEDDYVGKLALCWYPKNKAEGHDLELYFCRVLTKKVGDHVTAELYYGETYDPTRLKGTFNDVCFGDLSWEKYCFE